MEEAFDTWNAIKIGVINKPIGFLNIEGYFDELFSFIANCEDKGFISSSQAKIPKINADPQLLLRIVPVITSHSCIKSGHHLPVIGSSKKLNGPRYTCAFLKIRSPKANNQLCAIMGSYYWHDPKRHFET